MRRLAPALVAVLALATSACGGGGGGGGSTAAPAGTTTSPSSPTLTLSPSSVAPGDAVSISGSAGDCPPGDDVIVISRAFPGPEEFAGVPAVTAPVQSDGSFSASATIASDQEPGTYDVTARCGGGNLGLLEHLTVTG